VQQRHRHARRVGRAVEFAYQPAANAVAPLSRMHEHQHEVGGGRQADHRRDPVRTLRPLCGEQPDGLTVPLGQPGPRRRPGKQADRLPAQRRQRIWPFVDRAEAGIEPDQLQRQPGDDVGIWHRGAPDAERAVKAAASAPQRLHGRRLGGAAARRGARGEHLKRVKPVPQQRQDAVRVAARPADDRRGVILAGSPHHRQVVAPLSEQLPEPGGDVRARDRGGELEAPGGTPGQVE